MFVVIVIIIILINVCMHMWKGEESVHSYSSVQMTSECEALLAIVARYFNVFCAVCAKFLIS